MHCVDMFIGTNIAIDTLDTTDRSMDRYRQIDRQIDITDYKSFDDI